MAMAHYCELELALGWRKQGIYSLAMRYSDPESEADVRSSVSVDVALEPEQFKPNGGDMNDYGRRLTSTLLGDAKLRQTWGKARAAAQAKNGSLRVRLFLDADALDLHKLRWETLHDPEDDSLLFAKEEVLFSRYLTSNDWRPVPTRSKSALRALVVIANPNDLAKYAPNGKPLAPIDVAGELKRAQASLGSIECEALAGGGAATLDGITEKLRDHRGFDILYVVCHGAKIDDVPKLWLENPDGSAHRVFGKDLVLRVQDMLKRPRLVVLASCQSAGTGQANDDGVLAAIGPRLAEAGVPAVLAMQGNITMETVATFMPVFFRELDQDGQVDRAMSVARAAVRDRPDWWMPALFMRLKTGRLWSETGFGPDKKFDRLEALCTDIRDGTCIPVLGPGLVESLLGSLRQIAQDWAERYGFPLAAHNRDELAQVSQFLAYRQTRNFMREQLREYLRSLIVSKWGDRLPADLLAKPNDEGALAEIITALGKVHREEVKNDVHARLAGLPFPIFVTANRDNLLCDALVAAGKRPRVEVVRWKRQPKPTRWPKSPFDADPDFEPDEDNPLVLHLFGNIQWPETVVLTEDDYFDFLIGVTRGQDQPKPPIPLCISSRLAGSGLLFLGFQPDDWDFRILYCSVLAQEGGRLAEDHVRVAVQLNPTEGRILEPLGARKYFERYFQRTRDVGVYWGSVDEFIADLAAKYGAP